MGDQRRVTWDCELPWVLFLGGCEGGCPRGFSVVVGFDFFGGAVAETGVKAGGVEPVDPFEGHELDFLDGAPWLACPDQFGSVGGVDGLGEGVVGLYKNECVKLDGPFRTTDELELATLSWVHWFNESRLHSSIGYLTPIEKEDLYYRENTTQQQPLLGELALH